MKYLFLIATLMLSGVVFAAEGDDELVDGKFRVKGVSGLNLSQTSLTNWSAGGESSLAGTAYFNGTAERKSGNWLWANSLALEYGLTSKSDQGVRKIGDKIDFSTQLGYKATDKWYYTALADFKTQFAKGYNYKDDQKGPYISKFMAPGYSNLSLGIEYRPKNFCNFFFSPAAGKFTFVADDSLSNAGAFGVDPGDKFRAEFGTYLKGRYEKEVVKNVKIISTVDFFTPYNKDFGNIDVNWDMLISMKVNKYLSATVNTTLKYDDDIKSVDQDGNAEGPKVQFKEVLGIGFAYNF